MVELTTQGSGSSGKGSKTISFEEGLGGGRGDAGSPERPAPTPTTRPPRLVTAQSDALLDARSGTGLVGPHSPEAAQHGSSSRLEPPKAKGDRLGANYGGRRSRNYSSIYWYFSYLAARSIAYSRCFKKLR